MNVTRKFANTIRFILDELVPPIIRDSKWFMWIPFKLLFGDKSGYFFDFKKQFAEMSDSEIAEVYKKTESVHLSRKTDLNEGCIKRVLNAVQGQKVLDVGCGRGFLTDILQKTHTVTGVDFIKHENFDSNSPQVDFVKASITGLPFDDESFDTVICTHTLEHVKDIESALCELRRVCKSNLILVVPKQRSYQYTFDLHVHFFPYDYDFLKLTTPGQKFEYQVIETIDGDFYYQESMQQLIKK